MYQLLVVEDEYWMRKGLCKAIGKMELDFQIYNEANNGKEALEKLKDGKIDLVITDLRMPVMGGLELMEKMKELQLNQPVIIITGHNEFEYARTAFRLGAVDYLLKPVKNQELYEVLENTYKQMSEEDRKQQDSGIQTNEPNDSHAGAEAIQSVLEMIKQQYMEDLSLSVLADQFGFNSSYLSRLFKMETGKGFVQYLREIRMQHACEMLLQSEWTIEQIAKQTGFQDEKHFRRTFKKEFGLPPSEYRESSRSKK